MQRLRLAWVCVISLLLVLTVGTIAAGRLSGVSSLHLGGSAGAIGGGGGSNSTETRTGFGVSPVSGTATATSSSSNEYVPPVPSSITPSDWLLYATAGLALAAGLAFLLRSSGEAGVYDFTSAIDQLDKQRSLVEGSWSLKLRNVALLRYYSLMSKICTQMGLADGPSETPLEYLGRVADALKISQRDASDFAAAFDRARYGGELSDEDARNAAALMARFVNGLRESVPHG
ncbi:MAG: DUF4129 domain-containing protein [Thaumarchaeota archaeon]|nr:DUF4129 domain-containing protein [Nitrososphaerota archaeon]